jgi:uncharacterized membrane protein
MKSKNYWLKGCLIGIGFAVIAYLLIWIFKLHFLDPIFLLPRMVSAFVYFGWIYDAYNPTQNIDIRFVTLFITSTLIMYGVLGAIIGQIYGKIKNRLHGTTTN